MMNFVARFSSEVENNRDFDVDVPDDSSAHQAFQAVVPRRRQR